MKRLAFFLAAVAALLAMVPDGTADCRRVVVQQKAAVVVTPAVVTPVVATTFLTVPVPAYPVLGASYGQGDVAAELKALRQELGEAVRALRPAAQPRAEPMPKADAAPQPPAAPGFDQARLLAAVNASCARCHGVARKEAKLSLVSDDGKALARLPQVARLKAFLEVSTAKMPRGGQPVSQETLELFAGWAELPD